MLDKTLDHMYEFLSFWVSFMFHAIYTPCTMADPGDFIGFHGNPFSNVINYSDTFMHCLMIVVKNIPCTIT